MTVSTESLNKAVGQVSGNVSTTTDQARSELIDLSTAARATNFQGTAGEVLAGIEAVASVASTSVPLATLTESIPGLSQELIQQIDPGLMAGLNALEGTSSSAGTASEAFLHEVITTGTPQAINSALNELTGKVAENQRNMQAEISGVLSQVSGLQEKLGSQQQAITDKIAADTQLIVQRVEGNQAVMSGLKKKIEADQGPMEELSKGKRKFVALTTVLGGFVWFVVNVFGGGN